MADLKISQLPAVTTLATTDVFPVVNTNETKQVSVNNLSDSLPITTFVRSASSEWAGAVPFIRARWEPQPSPPTYPNLVNGVDYFIPWNFRDTNETSDQTFELVNANTSNARIHIKTTGLYDFIFEAIFFDLHSNMRFSGFLDFNNLAAGGGWTRRATFFQNTFAYPTPVFGSIPTPPAVIVRGVAQVNITTSNLYWSAAVNPSANTPFPATVPGNNPTNPTVTNLLIRRIGD